MATRSASEGEFSDVCPMDERSAGDAQDALGEFSSEPKVFIRHQMTWEEKEKIEQMELKILEKTGGYKCKVGIEQIMGFETEKFYLEKL